jgi:hypothetical protein
MWGLVRGGYMEELQKELVKRFNWVVWDLPHIIQLYGAKRTVKFLINLLWEQYHSSNSPLLPKQEIIAWIGELENLLSKHREEV